ncbi:hypothetical protein [Paenibacillus sp. YN15]|uniref:hypothetical protein n=1 Tax=Paenibacillus sp. YN15 TaxID=1742774 RepID=UPI000DCF4DAD|nr:hypothetical protein [Paenibacillus sp. YN15]RAV01716.1 hypothetical protein DQG13_11425 [Paenibacillus sp. YN15]
MNVTHPHYTYQWINDHLDLYNYAGEQGDRDWQQEILQALAEKEQRIASEWKAKTRDELWRQYDEVNGLLLELYAELRGRDKQAQQELIERLLLLKQQRLEISRQLAIIS